MKSIKQQLSIVTYCLLSTSIYAESISSVAVTEVVNAEWFRNTAVSPNGEQISFSYHGDIYLVSSAGGKAIPLTTHQAHEDFPIWSNDGTKLAFASDRYGNYDIFVIDSQGGSASRLTHHSSDDIPMDFDATDRAILFNSLRTDSALSSQFPDKSLPETYQVNLNGGTPTMISTIATERAQYNSAGDKILYHDQKGYEDPWRKHHRSSITRDIWLLNPATDEHQQITHWLGEERNPLWLADQKAFVYLSERSGSFNVWRQDLQGSKPTQITFHNTHPVRSLSQDQQGNLVYSYHGSIYRLPTASKDPQRVDIEIATDDKFNPIERHVFSKGVSEFAISPNGKEIAFVVRGEVFVTAIDFKNTRRITNTPEQERSVSFSPDGRAVLYAGDRNGSWNLYQTKLVDDSDNYFYSSLKIKEEILLNNGEESFQPSYSPNGEKVAYLENRDTLKILNLKNKETRVTLSQNHNYSYSDGDIYFEWAPDSKWIAISYSPKGRWVTEIGIVEAAGTDNLINISNSGYYDGAPHWAMNGNAITWTSSRNGMRNHGSHGTEGDIYAAFLNQNAYDQFKLSKQELALQEDSKPEEDTEDESNEGDEKQKYIVIEVSDLEDRIVRLTKHSSRISDGLLNQDGRKLYYLAKFEGGLNLWEHDFEDESTQKISTLNADVANLKLTAEGDDLIVSADGVLKTISLDNGKRKDIGFAAEMLLRPDLERRFMFEHIWRQTFDKFYLEGMHGVDWPAMKARYQPKLTSINNTRDLSTMMSEMLGELNASHTGAKYRPTLGGDKTAALGIFIDHSHRGAGIKIAEITPRSPLFTKDNKVTAGMVITAIDGINIEHSNNYYQLLNHKTGKRALLAVQDPKTKTTFEQVVKPISLKADIELRYHRWVKNRAALTDILSEGKLGYVHVQRMNNDAFQSAYSDVLGRNVEKQALIVDSRFNGGGWLHDKLNTFLSGQKYFTFTPRGREIGSDSEQRWQRGSAVMTAEGNYSDAYLFPYSYQLLGLGKLVGMPVPATGTAVWWERSISGDIIAGIPQLGMKDPQGNLQENRDLMPDYLINNDPTSMARGQDKQLEETVEVLLQP